ncbi:uncharacterized protein VTP21DRAFT_5327 [Calcarisporiella thermophila]|uniref:uncharacterized protein n=1 Tax=Calcarisporiella thermophila TaxID=911321 RepID=UPI0037432F6F
MKLNCMIKNGDEFSEPFPVKIDEAESIHGLKEVIQQTNKKQLDAYDISQIKLWKSDIPFEAYNTSINNNFVKAKKRLLSPLDEICEIFPEEPRNKYIHIIVELPIKGKNQGTENKRRLDTDEGPSKRPTMDTILKMISPYQALFDRIMTETPRDPEEFSDPSKLIKLPFPFLGLLPVDRFNITDGCFIYMGREGFARVLAEIENFRDPSYYNRLYVYGSIGYGKSHILAAMACLLFQQGKRVVYLPDCRAMAQNFLRYLKEALLLTFGDSESYQLEILKCDTTEKINAFCDEIFDRDSIRLYFIIDQLNALDHELVNRDNICNTIKSSIQVCLDQIMYSHYAIKSASANFQSAIHMEQKQLSEKKIALLGGLTKAEMQEWWKLYSDCLPNINQTEKEFIEDITGRTPLFLRALLRLESNRDFKDIKSNFLNSQELLNIPSQVVAFAEQKKIESNQQEWRRYIDVMRGCLLNKKMLNTMKSYDHRYFYIDENYIGHYTCGLARAAMSGIFREVGEDIFLDREWLNRLRTFKDNPSVLGFVVEQASLSSISQNGLKVNGLGFSNMKTIVFSSDFPTYNFDLKLALYIPLAYNFKAIDGLILSLDEKNKTAHLVPIQITISKYHSDSESKFFANWNSWTQDLIEEGYTIKATFLWITEGNRATEELEAKLKETRQGAILIQPEHTSVCVAIEDVNRDIGERLKRVRRLHANGG